MLSTKNANMKAVESANGSNPDDEAHKEFFKFSILNSLGETFSKFCIHEFYCQLYWRLKGLVCKFLKDHILWYE